VPHRVSKVYYTLIVNTKYMSTIRIINDNYNKFIEISSITEIIVITEEWFFLMHQTTWVHNPLLNSVGSLGIKVDI
jgi:hypothetical protein